MATQDGIDKRPGTLRAPIHGTGAAPVALFAAESKRDGASDASC